MRHDLDYYTGFPRCHICYPEGPNPAQSKMVDQYIELQEGADEYKSANDQKDKETP